MAVHSASLPHPQSSTDDEDGCLICLQPHSLDRNCTFFTPSIPRLKGPAKEDNVPPPVIMGPE